MIVLDEHLKERGLTAAIAEWYPGSVANITDLRPGTTIKDDVIPSLLRTASKPIFVTINVRDFWRRIGPDPSFAIACFDWPHDRVRDIPRILRRFLSHRLFRAKRQRMGKIARVSESVIQYYDTASWAVRKIAWDGS